MTILDVIQWLMPKGTGSPTDKEAQPSWEACPDFPADLFGVAAYLAEESGLYAIRGTAVNSDPDRIDEKKKHREETEKLAEEWIESELSHVPAGIQELWEKLLKHKSSPVVATPASKQPWHRLVLQLMAIADEVACGWGFLATTTRESEQLFQQLAAIGAQVAKTLNEGESQPPGEQPTTLCQRIPPEKLCVMPKALTTGVGCTLRSLSHHLALLPGHGLVRSYWHLGARQIQAQVPPPPDTSALNVLIIPFPYVIRGTDFRVGQPPIKGERDGYFVLKQEWIPTEAAEEKLLNLVEDLLKQAELEVGTVHQILFPECALTKELTLMLAEKLGPSRPKLESIIAGTLDPDSEIQGITTSNYATIIELIDGKVAAEYSQRKHHRWKLTPSQIEGYRLAHVLDPRYDWWETTSLEQREVHFLLNHRNWVRSVLVCEDLARFDPVLPTLNAIGPNWVIALLLDGPQLEKRWPARYATVLSEDPGSSVLTITCSGMVDRAQKPGFPLRRVIGLWKDGAGGAVELELPQAAHALVLTLTERNVTQRTLDGRTDGDATTQLKLSGQHAVRLEDPHPWIHRHAPDAT
jgi:hypothetical protein